MSFWCWVVWVLYIFWILTPCQIYHLPVSPPIHRAHESHNVTLHIGRTLSVWVTVFSLKTLLTLFSCLLMLLIQKTVNLIYSYLACSLILNTFYSLYLKYYHMGLDIYYSLFLLCRKDPNMFLQLKQVVFYLFDHCFCSVVFSEEFLFYVHCIFLISVPGL